MDARTALGTWIETTFVTAADWAIGATAILILLSLIVAFSLPSPRKDVPPFEAYLAGIGMGTFPPFLALIFMGAWIVIFGLAVGASAYQLWTAMNPDSSEVIGIGVGTLVIGLLGAPFLIWRTIVAQSTVDVAKENQVTDLINKAVEGLGSEKSTDRIGRPVTIFHGDSKRYIRFYRDIETFSLPQLSIEISREPGTFTDDDGNFHHGTDITISEYQKSDTRIEWQGSQVGLSNGEVVGRTLGWEVFTETRPNLEVRIGALLALERLAKNNLDVHIQIMEILTAYIRENAPATDLEPSQPPFNRSRPRSDIQMALTVLGRRSELGKELEWSREFRLDLKSTDLSGADLFRADLKAANLIGSRLEATSFREADLCGAWLSRTLLNFGDFAQAKMWGTRLDFAIFNMPVGKHGSITFHPDISVSDFRAISTVGADLTAVTIGIPKSFVQTFGSKDTKLSVIDRHQLPDDDVLEYSLYKNLSSDRTRHDEDKLKKLVASGFQHWCPLPSSDMATEIMRSEFLDAHMMTDWPYRG